jgi:WD40 repeat protein
MRVPRRLHCFTFILLAAACARAEAAGPRLDASGAELPDGAIARFGSSRFRHDQPVFGVAFSSDGKILATGGSNRMVCLWEAKTGKLLKRFLVNSYAVQSICFSPKGDLLILGGQDASIRIVNAKTGAEQRVLAGQHRSMVTSVCVSADGKSMLSTDQTGQTVLWNLATGAVRRRYGGAMNSRFSGPAILDDGKSFVVMGSDGFVRKIETSSGKELAKFVPAGSGNFFRGMNQAYAVSPDGKYLAAGGYSRPLTVWDLKTGKQVKRIDNQQASNTNSLTFTPNGRFLAVSIPGQAVVFFGVASGKELRRLKAAGYQPNLAFSPDGKTVALATGNMVVRLWNVAAARDVFPGSGHQGQILSVAFTPDAKHLISSGNMGEACLWEVTSSRELAVHHFNFVNGAPVQLSADGKRVLVLGYDRNLRTWKLPLAGASSESSQQQTGITNPYQASLSPDGKSLVAMSPDRKLMLYDLAGSSKPKALSFLQNGFFAGATFAPDSRRVAMSGPDGSVQAWDVATGRRLLSLEHNNQPRYYYGGSRLAFAADGRSLLVFDALMRVIEIASGRERFAESRQLPRGGYYAPGNVQLAYAADGRLVARGNFDGSIQVYSTRTGKELVRWQSQQGMIHALAFSRDGKRLASGGANGTILVWQVPQETQPAVVLDAGKQAQLWRELGSGDAHRAYEAMRVLAADPVRSLPFFKERLRPPPAPNMQRMVQLIADLDNDAYRVRERASKELAAAGAQLEDTLRKALAKAPSAEAKRRLRHLLACIREGGTSTETLRLLRILEVVDNLDTPEARQFLQELARVPFHHAIAGEIRTCLEHHPGPPAAPAPKSGE